VIVCDSAGILAGVVTKTDVVSQICHCHGAGCITAASLAMTRDVAVCRPKGLAARCLGRHEGAEPKNIPVGDQDSRPLGLLHARDILQCSSQKLRRRGINVARLCDGPRLLTAASCQTSGQNEVVGQSSETQLPIFDGSAKIPMFNREARHIW
jgi:CBS-domain-containing membrane protein